MNLMIIDGNSIVNRAFYGIRQLSAPDGTPTNAVYGFITILQRIYDEIKPDAVCVAFDLKGPTFRHLEYAGYKAQRKGMPEELAAQMPILKETLDEMGIKRYELEGYEADDILGTAAAICEDRGWNCTVVTGDKDSLQLVSDSTTVCNVKTRMGQTETIFYTPKVFEEEYGFEPKKMVDLKALMGDASDNIPGVPGVGEKTALGLLHRFGSLDDIYRELDSPDIRDSQRKKLKAGEESARKSFWLATILRDAPLKFEPEDNLWHRDYKEGLYELFKRLGFNKFIEKWGLESSGEDAGENAIDIITPTELDSADEAEKLIEKIKKADYIAVEAENRLDKLEIFDGEKLFTADWSLCGEEYNELLKTIFSADVKKLGHNIKDLMGLLLDEGLSTDGFIFDTALAAYLLEATDSDYSLPRLSQGYLAQELSGAQAIYDLYPILLDRLKELSMDRLYFDAELPLCAVLADMEHTGFYVDRKALYDYGESLNSGISELQKSIWDKAGEEFNINSPKQLGNILFEKLELPHGKRTKTGWSTNADVLDKLRGEFPIVDDVLEYRMLTKLKSTYAEGLLKLIAPDGRIHTSFQMTVTATGRLSSTDPNLQNIPVRKKLGAQLRNMFVAGPGMCLVDADYSQIELRILAHMSNDETMRNAFINGEDFHRITASNVFNVSPEDVTPTMRSRAKAVNFGIVYGISAFSLAQDIGVWTSEAKAYMDAYLEKFHGVRDYMKNVVEKAKKDGYVSTIYGRRRKLPELKSSNFNTRSFGERVALNMPIQGTAADIIKLAMVNVHKRLVKEKLNAKLILQVHDELIAECPETEAEKVETILKEEMENAVRLTVPLTADAHIGHSWAEAH
ncbi:MAG: DNA polymerase I [Candidatus Limivicinus sp.]|jgi:DNA polymerase-1